MKITIRHAVCASLSLASAGIAQEVADITRPGDQIVIEMAPCKMQRPLEPFWVLSSKKLVLEGTIAVDGEQFRIYLPRDKKNAYSIQPRPKRKKLTILFTSTYLAVDQDHDGEIAKWESYYAEFPLRIGDSMFDVMAIAPDGSTITLRPSDHRLAGAVVGRQAPDFEFRTVDGRVVRRDDFKGKALVIDCWAPT